MEYQLVLFVQFYLGFQIVLGVWIFNLVFVFGVFGFDFILLVVDLEFELVDFFKSGVVFVVGGL